MTKEFEPLTTEIVERVQQECVRYGLEEMSGNPAEILLRHITNNHNFVIGTQKLHIEKLQEEVKRLRVIEEAAWEYVTSRDPDVDTGKLHRALLGEME